MSDDLIRKQQAVKLTAVCHQAKRVVAKVGTDDFPTQWDCLHRYMDELLDEMVMTHG